jgi:hypothetical protein
LLIVRAASDLFFPPKTPGAVHGKRHRADPTPSDAVITQPLAWLDLWCAGSKQNVCEALPKYQRDKETEMPCEDVLTVSAAARIAEEATDDKTENKNRGRQY